MALKSSNCRNNLLHLQGTSLAILTSIPIHSRTTIQPYIQRQTWAQTDILLSPYHSLDPPRCSADSTAI